MVKQQKTIDTARTRWIVAFGQRLERARGRMGLTQAELAGADLSKSFVSLLETARSYPSVETLLLLARRAGTSVAGLLMDAGELRLDTSLNLLALAHESVWTRPAWAVSVIRAVEELVPDTPLWLKAEATIVRGIAATLENRLAEAEKLARRAKEYAENAGYAPGQAHALALMGDVALLRREFTRSFTLLSQAVALYRQSGSLRSEPGIKALIWLGAAAFRVGRAKYARRTYTKARTLASRLNLSVLEGQALWGLGYLAQVEGDLGKAGRLLQDAKRAFEEGEDLINLGEVLMNLGVLYGEQGRLDQALAVVQQSIRIIEKVGSLRHRSAAHMDLAGIQLQMGNFEEAEKAAQQALDDAGKVDDRKHRATALATLGRVAAARKERSKAIRYLRESAQHLKALGLKDLWAEVSRDLGLLLKGGTPEVEAAQYLTQAINPEALPGGAAAFPTRAPARRSRATRRSR